MPPKTPGQKILENAYLLHTPEDNQAYYDDFALTYDSDFAQDMGWDYPRAISETYRRLAGNGDVPVADIGCGTGYVAAELGLSPAQIDGMDISAEMMAVAKGKGLYRALYQIDLTGPLDRIANGYGAVLSAGTFTHGHLGPEPLEALLTIARPGALFVIGVNQVHFAGHPFGAMLDRLTALGRIGPVTAEAVRMYRRDGHDHSGDQALVLQYRKV